MPANLTSAITASTSSALAHRASAPHEGRTSILALWPYSLLIMIMLAGLWLLSVAGLSYRQAPPQPSQGDTRPAERTREPGKRS